MLQFCKTDLCDGVMLGWCCNQSLCRDHFVEHDRSIRSTLNRLNSQIDELIEQFNLFDPNRILTNALNDLNQWRIQSYRIIDQFYQKKSEQIRQYILQLIGQQKIDLNDLKHDVIKLINVQRTTSDDLNSLISNIEHSQEQLNDIKEMSLNVELSPLILNEENIETKISLSNRTDLSKLSSECRSINRLPLSSDAFASNEHFLLIHQNCRLLLINEDFEIVQKRKWSSDYIVDMCWSSTLDCFFLLTANKIYRLDIETFVIEEIITTEGDPWECCSCSETSLFLSTERFDSMIHEYSLTPSIKLIQQWKRNSFNEGNQRIDSLVYENQQIVLIINDQTKQQIMIESRSTTNFDCLWLYSVDIEYSERKIYCCSFLKNQWLIVDYDSSSILQMTEDGQWINQVKYPSKVNYISMWKTNHLVISTNNSFNIHQLSNEIILSV